MVPSAAAIWCRQFTFLTDSAVFCRILFVFTRTNHNAMQSLYNKHTSRPQSIWCLLSSHAPNMSQCCSSLFFPFLHCRSRCNVGTDRVCGRRAPNIAKRPVTPHSRHWQRHRSLENRSIPSISKLSVNSVSRIARLGPRATEPSVASRYSRSVRRNSAASLVHLHRHL